VKIIHGYRGLSPDEKGASVALGNFDGVHRGHSAVIAAAAELVPGAPSGVVTFDPHPRSFFQPDAAPFLLTPMAQKSKKLSMLSVERLHILPFDAAMAAMTPEDFARDVLADGLGVAGIAVGSDFRFGAKRAGDVETLHALGASHGFKVVALEEVADESGSLLSSSTARAALREGRPEDATDVLGGAHIICGEVLMGDQRGRTIGFPTANLSLDGLLAPAFGVYAVTVTLPDGETVKGVANIGMRPTFEKTAPNLEVHLFDFQRDLYGQTIEVALHHFVRGERKFDGIDALKAQIAEDADTARRMLADV